MNRRSWFITWGVPGAPPKPPYAPGRDLIPALRGCYSSARGHQVPRRRHARAVARREHGRLLLEVRRDVREERDRLRVVLRAAVLADPRARADHVDGRHRRAHHPAEVRTERAHHAVPLAGDGGP